MPLNFNFSLDRELMTKRIKTTKLGSKVAITAVILLAVVGFWLVLEFVLLSHTLVTHDYATLVKTPFSFIVNPDSTTSKTESAHPIATADSTLPLI